MNKLKRYLLFLIGLFISSLGVSLVTKASLGTSPISSIPYVLSLYYPLTLGNFTIIFSLFLIMLQVIILRKNFKMENVLQIPVSIAFGYFIDFTMHLLAWVNPETYLIQIIILLIGCLVLAFGVYMEVLADVVMLPGESFVRAIVVTWHTNFGTTKVIFDSSMTIIAGILSFVFFNQLNGVREGTIICALLVGFIARLIGKKMEFIKPYLFPEEYIETNEEKIHASSKNVIVIGRQYGSGGHDIGKALAEKLGYEFYDQEIIEMIAGTIGMSPNFISRQEETMINNLLYDFANQMYLYGDKVEESPKDKIFEAESKTIKELAEKGNCVIVGRCSDYILRDQENVLKLFLSAPLKARIKRTKKKMNINDKEAEQKIHKEDKRRSDNYHYYTNRVWGMACNYDLSLNTELGLDIIEEIVQKSL